MNPRYTAFLLFVCASAALSLPAAESSYRQVENWAQFPAGRTEMGGGSRRGCRFARQRLRAAPHPAMPTMVFDRSGKFLRAWGNPTAVTVDSGRRDYVAEVNGANVKTFVMKK